MFIPGSRVIVAALLALPQLIHASASLTTLAERTGYRETGRYAEVEQLCRDFQRTFPDAVRCLRFGTSPEGRPLRALVASRSGALTPAAARRRGIPVVMMQGGIHAGEIDGKDAGFLALRELLSGAASPGSLNQQVILFVPVFSVDGHERFGAWNRPNQRGPEAMGWRTTGQNLNLNRDYVKADAPEMQAMLRLINAWDPLMLVDLHATDGAQFQHDIAVTIEPRHSGDSELQGIGAQFSAQMMRELEASRSQPVDFYPAFEVDDDPASGFARSVSTPRFSAGYMPLRNRFGVLVETHSWKDYPTRVRITRNAIVAAVAELARNGRRWQQAARAADRRATTLGGLTLPIAYDHGPTPRIQPFLGYAYTRTGSDVSGTLMTRYDAGRAETWQVPIYDDVVIKETITAPRAGYVIPVAHARWCAQKLALHGIQSQIVRQTTTLPVQAFRASATRFSLTPYEGRQRLEVDGEWGVETRAVSAGALWVPLAQPKARLIVNLLEPRAPDSLLAWGFFNAHFERKEYMEDYVAEEVARAQLDADPALAESFRARLAADPAFAASPAARLEFFYRRHPSWDERFNLYPVLRLDTPPGSL